MNDENIFGNSLDLGADFKMTPTENTFSSDDMFSAGVSDGNFTTENTFNSVDMFNAENTFESSSDINISQPLNDTSISSESNNEDLIDEAEPSGITGLVLSLILLLWYFIILYLSEKEQLYTFSFSLETFYIFAPVALIANGVSYKSLMGKIGSVIFIGVMILQLIQEFA